MPITTTIKMATTSGCSEVDIPFRDATSCVRKGFTKAISAATTAVIANTVHWRLLIGIADVGAGLLRFLRSRVRWRCGSVGMLGKG